MFKPTTLKLITAALITALVLALYILFFRFIYIPGNLQCHLTDCLPDAELIQFWIRPTCCGYTMRMLISEIMFVVIPTFLLVYIILSLIKAKK
jgi:hypothetical protein